MDWLTTHHAPPESSPVSGRCRDVDIEATTRSGFGSAEPGRRLDARQVLLVGDWARRLPFAHHPPQIITRAHSLDGGGIPLPRSGRSWDNWRMFENPISLSRPCPWASPGPSVPLGLDRAGFSTCEPAIPELILAGLLPQTSHNLEKEKNHV